MSTVNYTPASAPNAQKSCLAEYVAQTFIIAYREVTDSLEKALSDEGLAYQMLRQEPVDSSLNYSPSYLCMMNHRRAWEKTVEQNQPSLVVEADFVPVIGMGQLPIPFNPQSENVGIAWLYTCAPQLYSVSKEGYASGYSTSAVAYILTPKGAKGLIELSQKIIRDYGETNYSTWDSLIDEFLRSHELKNYLPFRNYGEHGGQPNPEHRQNGLSPTHRGDVLYGRLAFMPEYTAKDANPQLKFLIERLKARLRGIARLGTGKYVRVKVLRLSSTPWQLLKFAITRQMTFFP